MYRRWVDTELFDAWIEEVSAVTLPTFDASLKQLLGPLVGGRRVRFLGDEILASPAALIGGPERTGSGRSQLRALPLERRRRRGRAGPTRRSGRAVGRDARRGNADGPSRHPVGGSVSRLGSLERSKPINTDEPHYILDAAQYALNFRVTAGVAPVPDPGRGPRDGTYRSSLPLQARNHAPNCARFLATAKIAATIIPPAVACAAEGVGQ